MFGSLHRHPFGVEAFFRRSLVLTYAVPAQALIELVGPGLQIDAYDEWGFLAIAMVETQGLRPQGFPRWLGRDFFLSGYRIFTRLCRPGQPTLRGLRILRSDTDRRMMASLGNLFTHYNYQRADVHVEADEARLSIRIATKNGEADLDVVADLAGRPAPLPEGTPFRSMEDAKSFAGPLPFTFSFDRKIGKMVVVKGIRKAWDPQSVQVTVQKSSYLEHPPFAGSGVRLASAFYLEKIPYAWKPGVLEDIA
jgi:hypothetical protein